MSDENKAILDWLTLNLVPGLGPRLTRALLSRFGTPDGILKAPLQEIASIPHMGFKTAEKLRDAFGTVKPQEELDLMRKHGVSALPCDAPAYPGWLSTLHDPPAFLYMRGNLLKADEKCVAMVGSRACTDYGKKMARRIASGLARSGWTVVSGLARGIDAAAHHGALEGGGRTIAVLAGGLSKIYPPEHKELAEEVALSGALVTESHMRQEPLPGLFPARNRIISGLSKAILLIEAAEKSGALLTAVHAAEQGKLVLAVPGAIDSPASGGTNSLIRKGAILVRGVEDVLEEVGGVPGAAPASMPKAIPDKPPVQPKLFAPDLVGIELEIWQHLQGESLFLDQLAQRTRHPVQELASALLMMEMKKLVKRLTGNRFQLL